MYRPRSRDDGRPHISPRQRSGPVSPASPESNASAPVAWHWTRAALLHSPGGGDEADPPSQDNIYVDLKVRMLLRCPCPLPLSVVAPVHLEEERVVGAVETGGSSHKISRR